ncbi:adenosylcobinamide-GDP ribazoletransferase [Geomesophilobacter sediminis]|uniref:Adenosylcobinamide-GDP ribazoletransferase n=1 Tax=Geomesophilobacter sediminis TaxID=2798584 RepID=A0A8J7IQA4_9BACT|nr:adenosylcobinamide-GDP ribazoletransferase [Geomesophilobacter sediminis]MBJ6724774.1 adenosylcobinamide-GDP ribazoletransferase [Geomesophilobacter sediminis]
MRLIPLAWQFLTIVPFPFPFPFRDGDLGRSMRWFPLIGLLLGGLLAGVDYLLALALPRPVTDLILIALLAAVTGGMHLDGLADVCDGIAARGSRERFLDVMKDSRVGAVGAVALVLGIALKYQALAAIPLAGKREALLFFPVAGRAAQVLFAVGSRRARVDGLGAAMVDGAGKTELALAGLSALAVAWFLFGWRGVGCLAVLACVTLAIKAWSHGRLGGITGDVIGCVNELNEILALLLILALPGKG